VTLEFRDNGGKIMRRFSSDENLKPPKAELYFDKAWLKPPERLSGAPGMHRFVWDLRYERPDSVNYGYSIAAVWEHDTPLEPNGPFALPGKYTVVLQADRKEISAPLMISEDPRVSASLDDLAAELALSRKIDAAMEDATRVYREQAAFRHVLDARFPKDKTKRDPQMIAWIERLRAEPKAGAPSFAGAARKLAGIANALNSADAAPTPVQRRVVDDALAQFDAAKQDWDGAKSDALAPLNAALVRGGEKPVAVTAVDLEQVEEPDDGEDLP
jgi:hypothetical protein